MAKPTVKIKLENLRISYEKKSALQNDGVLELTGNTIALVGHNGAGKSTLIKTILELLQPTSGKVSTFWSQDGTEENYVSINSQNDMAFCPESGSVFRDITVESYIKLWCRMKCKSSSYYKHEGAKYIELLDVVSIMSKLGRELSKGQRRRVQTAIGFLIKPKLFLIDEPFDGLDVQRTHELGEIIRDNSSHMSFIISSHRMDVMERVSDYVIVLKDGKFEAFDYLSKVTNYLGGNSYIIEHEGYVGDDMVRTITDRIPMSVVTRHGAKGSIVTLTAKDVSEEDLKSLFSENNTYTDNIKIERFDPSLVDAMTLFLKSTA